MENNGVNTGVECAILKHYLCFDCQDTQHCKLNIKSKIFIDGDKTGDYIQQNLAFRREMEMNYAKTLDQNAALVAALKELTDEMLTHYLLMALKYVPNSETERAIEVTEKYKSAIENAKHLTDGK